MATRKKKEEKHEGQAQREAPPQQEAKLPADQEGSEDTRSRPTFRPRVDIAETTDALVLLVDVPGADRNEVDISLDRRELSIRAEVHDDRPEDMSQVYCEYEIGDYERRFQLSGDFDSENIAADMKNGVLTVTVPKAKQREAKRIQLRGR